MEVMVCAALGDCVETIQLAIGLGAFALGVVVAMVLLFCWFIWLPVLDWLERFSPGLRKRIDHFLINGC